MAAMADHLHDKPAAAGVSALAAQPPCCTHVSAIDSNQRKFNRSGRSRTALAALRTAAQPRRDPEKTKRISPPLSPPGGQPASG
jgi:hypothetical protein